VDSAVGRQAGDSDRQSRSGRSAGHGIVGMRERAVLLGGTLEARPRPGRGFRVVAHLPIGGEPA
jgi:signal transduction histidine kinase